jgi:predicted nucleotide-binding protein
MKERFEGPRGTRRLLESLSNQELILHDNALAKELAGIVTLSEYEEGQELFVQGELGRGCLFFILSGKFDLLVNGNFVAIMSAGQAVGEFPIVDPSLSYTVTIRARENSVVAMVAEDQFLSIAEDYSNIWKNMAKMLVARLRKANELFRPLNPKPRLFVGSSREGIQVARAIQNGLAHDPIDVILWTDGVFGASSAAFESLLTEVTLSDFGVFVVLPDDTILSRGTEHHASRDNVIFEIGLFMGELGRERTLLVKPREEKIKIPTDLLGLGVLEYRSDPGSKLRSSIGPVINDIRERVLTQGPKRKINISAH